MVALLEFMVDKINSGVGKVRLIDVTVYSGRVLVCLIYLYAGSHTKDQFRCGTTNRCLLCRLCLQSALCDRTI